MPKSPKTALFPLGPSAFPQHFTRDQRREGLGSKGYFENLFRLKNTFFFLGHCRFIPCPKDLVRVLTAFSKSTLALTQRGTGLQFSDLRGHGSQWANIQRPGNQMEWLETQNFPQFICKEIPCFVPSENLSKNARKIPEQKISAGIKTVNNYVPFAQNNSKIIFFSDCSLPQLEIRIC